MKGFPAAALVKAMKGRCMDPSYVRAVLSGEGSWAEKDVRAWVD